MKVNNTSSQPIQNAEVSRGSEAGKAKRAERQGSSEKSARVAADSGAVKTELSAKGKEFAHAQAVAHSAPDVREERIAELKKRIAEGKYQVDADQVADRMVDDHLRMGGA